MQFLIDYFQYIENLDTNQLKDEFIYNEIIKRTKFGRLSLLEGLITTHPLSKSVDIIKKRFPKLSVEIESDGEIYIEGEFDELDKHLPIFTNLGYFISTYTIDGNEWLKDFTGEIKPIALYLEPKYDYLIEEIPKVLYHTSPIKFKNKILKSGLTPRSGSKISNHPERIYLTDSLLIAYNFGLRLKKEKNSYYEDGFCIYSIDTKEISDLYSDINLREGGYYILTNISPDNLKLEKEIKL